MQGALFAALNGGQDLARDIENGFLDRLALTPMSGGALLAGQLGGALFTGVISAILYLLVGLLFGAGIAAGVGGALVLLVLAVTICMAFACFGTFVALRAGTGEAVQGFFPLFFVLLFLSSAFLPREFIEQDWFRTVATYNPVSYLVEGIRSLVITGWDAGALAAVVRHRRGGDRALPRAQLARPANAAGADMSSLARTRSVALAVAWRAIHNALTNPAILVPSILFPLFFFIAFAGGLSNVQNAPNFEYAGSYTAFQFGFVCIQAAAFGGVFTGFSIAADFEFGFARRLLLAAPNRGGIVIGYTIAAMVRACIVLCVVLRSRGSSAGWRSSARRRTWLALLLLALAVSAVSTLWAAGIAMRLRTMQAGPVMQMPIFILMFLAPVYVPLAADRRLGARGRALQPGDGDARGVARVHRRRAGRRSGSRPPASWSCSASSRYGRAAGCARPKPRARDAAVQSPRGCRARWPHRATS